MKKNLIFFVYLLSVIIVTAYIFKPRVAMIFITAMICILEVAAKVLLSFDQTDKKHVVWFKISFLIILNVLAVIPLLVIGNVSNNHFGGDTPGIIMLFYSLFFSIVGLDIYILYSYFFEKKKETLLT